MPIYVLTYENAEKIKIDRDQHYQKLEALKQKSPEQLWTEDLDQLIEFMK
jgi:hypothetical protein